MKDLMETYNMRKTDAAEKMKLTQAAITQYLKGERGAILIEEIAQSKETMTILSELSGALVEGAPEDIVSKVV